MLVREQLAMWVACLTLVLSPGAEEGEGEPVLNGQPLSKVLAQLDDANRGLQARAARALSEAPEELRAALIPKLVPLLASERENTRVWVAQALGQYGPASRAAVPALLPLLEGTQYERNRAAAAKALGLILAGAQPAEDVEKAVQALTRKFNEDYDKYADVRREAVRALGMIGPAAKSCIPHLAKALTDFELHSEPHQLVRQQAAWTCGRMGPLAAEHLDRLISMLQTEGEQLPEIVWAIGRIGALHENVVPNIVDKMERVNWNTRYPEFHARALEALETLGPKAAKATDYLVSVLKGGRVDAQAALGILRALKAIGKEAQSALPVVEEFKTVKSFARAKPEELEALRQMAAETAEALK